MDDTNEKIIELKFPIIYYNPANFIITLKEISRQYFYIIHYFNNEVKPDIAQSSHSFDVGPTFTKHPLNIV